MLHYLLQRILIMVPTLFGVLALTFLVTQLLPGGPVEHALSQINGDSVSTGGDAPGLSVGGWAYSGRVGVDAKQVDSLRALYGFDRPLLERFTTMLSNYLRFDLGESYYHHQSVTSLIVQKFGTTVALGIWTFLLTYLVSIPLGIAKAVRQGTHFDTITSLLVLTGYALPGFILGVLLILLLGGGSFLDIFPLRGLTSDGWQELSLLDKILDYFWHLVLPLIASSVSLFAIKTLLTKNLFLEELRRPYVLTARAKGLTRKEVLWKHVFRNSLLPLITGFPSTFISSFLTGSVLIETLFSIDGLGRLSYDAITNRDYPVVLGTLYVFTLSGMIIKLIADLAYVAADPRIKFSAQST